MSKIIADCEICKMNVGDPGFPICKHEEEDEKNGFMDISSKEMDTMYTSECIRFKNK